VLKIKSIYDRAESGDGMRILVERFWPEGVTTYAARLSEWMAELGPSYDLQRFRAADDDWDAYAAKYSQEILHRQDKRELLEKIARKARLETVTLLHGRRDSSDNHAEVLRTLINQMNENH